MNQTSAALIEEYLGDMKRCGRLLSPHSQKAYRLVLALHGRDVGNVGLMDSTRLDVKRTLLRWKHPNTQRRNHSVLASFYTWSIEEGYRETNPAQQVRKARATQARGYRLTRAEVHKLMEAPTTQRERWVIMLGLCTGARRAELIGLRGRHFARDGLVQIAWDAGAKGRKERPIPVLPELKPIVREIRALVGPDDAVLSSDGSRWQRGTTKAPLDHTTLGRIVATVAQRAGIKAKVTCHTLRYAFATMIAREAGLRAAQVLLGHASIETTARIYVDAPTIDEICEAVDGVSFLGERTKARPNLMLLSA